MRSERVALYERAQRLLYEEVGLIPLVYRVRTIAASKRLQNYTPNAFGLHDFRAVGVK